MGPVTWMLLISLLGALILWVVREDAVRPIALALSVAVFVLATLVALTFQPGAPGYQFVDAASWVPQIGVQYKVGVDGISLPMVWLTALLTMLVVIFSWNIADRAYFSLFFLLQLAVIGVFTALDLFLFYVFWELVLVPMYFIIRGWGGERKEYAAVKFFVYTFTASLVMLVGIMALYFSTGAQTFDITQLAGMAPDLARNAQILIFAALFIGFLVKMPQVPVHTWLPDAHVQAPTGGSVILAGVLLKLGSYGLIRVSLPLLPEGAQAFVPVMVVLGVLSILYAALVCLAQSDLKRLVAYSSISHMGMVLLGTAVLGQAGITAAVYMMFAHGLISGLLFMIVGAIHHGTGTREIPKLGGLALKAPRAGVIIMAGSLASLGLPGMVQFVAEFTIFVAAFALLGWWILLPVLTVVLTAGYYLWALKRSMFGQLAPMAEAAHDVKPYEFWPMMALVALIIVFGVVPAVWMGPIDAAVAQNVLEPILTLGVRP